MSQMRNEQSNLPPSQKDFEEKPRYGRPSNKGQSKMSARDYRKLKTRVEQNAEDTTSWSQSVNSEKHLNDLESKEDFKMQRKKNNFRKGPAPSKVTKESAPKDEPLFDGECPGATPERVHYSHNMEMSMFPLLVESCYNVMQLHEARLEKQLPFSAFLHHCNVALNAFLMQTVISQNQDSRFEGKVPYETIGASSYMLPQAITEYISGIGRTILASGELIHYNLPSVAIPRGSNMQVPPGTFGVCDATTHNVYECYVCPYVTKQRVIATRDGIPNYSPLPAGYYPVNGIPNKNLLGYGPIDTSSEGRQRLAGITFSNGASLRARLCYSSELKARVNIILERLSRDIKMSETLPEHKVNSAAELFLNCLSMDDVDAHLANRGAKICSSTTFGSAAANRANLFGYKRKRNALAVGPCYTIDGTIPEGWAATLNNNFEMRAPFHPEFGADRAAFRDTLFSVQAFEEDKIVIQTDWVRKHFKIQH